MLVVYHQIEFIQQQDLGFDQHNLIMFSRDGVLNEKLGTFLEEAKKIEGIEGASSMSFNFGRRVRWHEWPTMGRQGSQ